METQTVKRVEEAVTCDYHRLVYGMVVEAAFDAPTPAGPWANLCTGCVYRLPRDLKKMATKL